MTECEVYKKYYINKNNGRRVDWLLNEGSVELFAKYDKKYRIDCTRKIIVDDKNIFFSILDVSFTQI